ncbi:hypothetical protein K6Y31_22055, partial [Motilimonas cestriensis]
RFQLYNESGKLWLSVDGRGQVTEYQYNGAGQVTRELSYGTQLDTSAWLVENKLTVSGDDVLTLVNTMSDEEKALTRLIATEYDSRGRVYTVTNAVGQVTEYEYDNQGRIQATLVYGDGERDAARISRNHYDEAGRLHAQTDADGYVVEFVYDAAGRKTETRYYKTPNISPPYSGEYDAERVFYDPRGRQQFTLNRQGYLTETRFDEAARVTEVYQYLTAVAPGITEISSIRLLAGPPQLMSRQTRDVAGRLSVSEDVRGTETRYYYDSETGLLRQQTLAANTEESRSSYFNYNTFGEKTGSLVLASQQDWQAFNLSDTIAKKGTQVSYNVNGLKETQSHPATGTTHFY